MLVEDCVNDVTYRLRISPETRKVVHFDLLKPYRGDDVPRWMQPLRQKIRERRRPQPAKDVPNRDPQ